MEWATPFIKEVAVKVYSNMYASKHFSVELHCLNPTSAAATYSLRLVIIDGVLQNPHFFKEYTHLDLAHLTISNGEVQTQKVARFPLQAGYSRQDLIEGYLVTITVTALSKL
jgi:hypothetical protein